MSLTRRLKTSTRTTLLPLPDEAVWERVASGTDARHWYVDAAPFVFRGALDRLVGGDGRRWPPPGRPLLRAGDHAGFWEVTAAARTAEGARLVLEARVRAPGRVVLTTTVRPEAGGTRLTQEVLLEPAGLLGWAYLAVDLPARETVVELTHRHTLRDVRLR